MTQIFISYRRDDDPYAARGIYGALRSRFDEKNVYFDLHAIRAGLDFRTQIDELVAKCDVMLVVIGNDWLAVDDSGRSRLEDPDDLVRLEVSSALDRGIPVIPVLVGNAAIPSGDLLPEDIKPLVFRHAKEVRPTADFESQMAALIRSIEAVTPVSRSTFPVWATAVIVIGLTLIISGLLWRQTRPTSPAEPLGSPLQTEDTSGQPELQTMGAQPRIEILEPPITVGGVARQSPDVSEQLIIGRVQPVANVQQVTVNDAVVSVEEDGYFKTSVRVSPSGTKVEIAAINESGEGSVRILTLQPNATGPPKPEQYENVVGLIVNQIPGCSPEETGACDNVWDAKEKLALTYCVSREFGERYEKVAQDMGVATAAWEAAADIDFIHISSHDADCDQTNEDIVFDVRPVSDGRFLASGFYPHDARSSRSILIDESSFELDPVGKLQLVGVLRETLGHTLGFRHEHIRPEAGGVCSEDGNWRPLSETGYNPYSVMHYPQCNGLGDWSLELTRSDMNGVACLYGPAKGFAINTEMCESPVL